MPDIDIFSWFAKNPKKILEFLKSVDHVKSVVKWINWYISHSLYFFVFVFTEFRCTYFLPFPVAFRNNPIKKFLKCFLTETNYFELNACGLSSSQVFSVFLVELGWFPKDLWFLLVINIFQIKTAMHEKQENLNNQFFSHLKAIFDKNLNATLCSFYILSQPNWSKKNPCDTLNAFFSFLEVAKHLQLPLFPYKTTPTRKKPWMFRLPIN